MAFSKLAVLALLALQYSSVCAAVDRDAIPYLKYDTSFDGRSNALFLNDLKNGKITNVLVRFINRGDEPVTIESIYGSQFSMPRNDYRVMHMHKLPYRTVDKVVEPGETREFPYQFYTYFFEIDPSRPGDEENEIKAWVDDMIDESYDDDDSIDLDEWIDKSDRFSSLSFDSSIDQWDFDRLDEVNEPFRIRTNLKAYVLENNGTRHKVRVWYDMSYIYFKGNPYEEDYLRDPSEQELQRYVPELVRGRSVIDCTS